MYYLLDFIALYILNIVEVITGFYFFNRFLGRRTAWVHFIFFCFAVLVLAIYFPQSGISQSAVYVVLFVLDGILTDKVARQCQFQPDIQCTNITVFLCSFVIVVIIHLCNGIVNSLCGIVSTFVSVSGPLAASVIFMGMSFTFSFFMILLCFKMIERYIQQESGRKIYTLLFLFPILLILLVSEYIGSELSGNTIVIVKGRIINHTNYVPLLFMQILGIASLFGILYAYKKLQDGFVVEKKMCLLEQESHYLHQYVKEARLRYESTRSFRHDIRNHIMIMEELLQKGYSGNENEKTAQNYLNDMLVMSEELTFPVSTGRPVLDILLENKLGLAKEAQIEIECSLMVSGAWGISDIDFCIILSNALDNAITACSQMSDRGQKFIHITSHQQGTFLLIKVANSYNGTGQIKWETGLGNIKAVAEKYQGAVEIETEEGRFTLSVLVDHTGLDKN